MSGQSADSANKYYNAKAQSFFDIWGGEHIHFGLYDDDTETLAEASTKDNGEDVLAVDLHPTGCPNSGPRIGIRRTGTVFGE